MSGPEPSPLDAWMPIVPRHGRLLNALRNRRGKSMFGEIGWGALRDPQERWTDEMLFNPLRERFMVEDLTREMGAAGQYFVRITSFGEQCLDFGMMPREVPRPDLIPKLGREIAQVASYPPVAPAGER